MPTSRRKAEVAGQDSDLPAPQPSERAMRRNKWRSKASGPGSGGACPTRKGLVAPGEGGHEPPSGRHQCHQQYSLHHTARTRGQIHPLRAKVYRQMIRSLSRGLSKLRSWRSAAGGPWTGCRNWLYNRPERRNMASPLLLFGIRWIELPMGPAWYLRL